jgi:hypothetical protein
MTKIAGSGSESGSISQRHGSADPDAYQNVMHPQHWNIVYSGKKFLHGASMLTIDIGRYLSPYVT